MRKTLVSIGLIASLLTPAFADACAPGYFSRWNTRPRYDVYQYHVTTYRPVYRPTYQPVYYRPVYRPQPVYHPVVYTTIHPIVTTSSYDNYNYNYNYSYPYSYTYSNSYSDYDYGYQTGFKSTCVPSVLANEYWQHLEHGEDMSNMDSKWWWTQCPYDARQDAWSMVQNWN